jgi:hypothetical protein
LTRFSLGGFNPVNVSLAGKLKLNGNRITADFGAGGIGGNRNTATGNGYYRVSVDTDRDGSHETQRHFYRLLGDTNGDRVVNSVDQSNVNKAFGRKGTNLPPDVNGDGIVNTTDRDIVRKQLGRRLAAHLPLDD